MSIRRQFPLALLLCLGAAAGMAREQGQYRSRIQLDPLGEAGQGSELSAAELEQQIDSIDDPYARSSAGRFLARHHLQRKDYPAAVTYYQQALAADGLAAVANREMLRELAQVYLLQQDYPAAADTLQRALAIDLVPDARDFLLLAQARFRQGDYVATVVALDGISAEGLPLDVNQLRQALALYYRSGAFEQCEHILEQLLAMEPGNAAHWHQLVSVYLQQEKGQQALDQLRLAREKGLAFTVAELQLLVDLQALHGNPYGAARTLQLAMEQGEIPADARRQRQLFELWLQARERDRALAALEQAVASSGDTELYLYLAQLQMEDERWAAVERTVLQACGEQLQDRFVSRANLLLGVALLKQHRPEQARRAFINATLVGGAHAEAGEWLRFMGAAPATESERRRVRGPCYGSEGKYEELAAAPAPATASAEIDSETTGAASTLDITLKTVPATRFFYSAEGADLTSLLGRVRELAPRLNVSLVKAGGSAGGPLHVLPLPGGEYGLALPIRGTAQALGRYRIYNSEAFNCASVILREMPEDPADVLARFAAGLAELGYEHSGEVRVLLPAGAPAAVEVQLGIR
ncbi:hypothetical protein DWB85_05235 [Seongchinamella sediminis]|uniref:Uncharacterized protein n=1 Tax=Seongchinamella sediminis TaxID=2283635 RepID=A0A3L7E294_9GAMM|nr:tetratricopeptide repeat protein [Seongchinamella sediminis]RLQ22850.1 hypothetical protein DWB85_05235 [Seongchinamella sediminis]